MDNGTPPLSGARPVVASRDRPRRAFEAGPHLWSSGTPRTFDLADRSQRRRAYEIVLREGTPDDIVDVVDDALLGDLWNDLVLPAELRAAWEPHLQPVMQDPAKRAS